MTKTTSMKKWLFVAIAVLGLQSSLSAWEFEVIDLGTLQSDQSTARCINDSNQVCGNYTFQGKTYTFLWEPEKGLKILDLPESAVPVKINNKGEIAGQYYSKCGQIRGFIWYPVYGFMDLGSLEGGQVWVKDINDLGQIVGQMDMGRGNPNERHAFLWDKGAMFDLGALSGDLGLMGEYSLANQINNQGEIIGFATKPLVHKGRVAARKCHGVIWQNNNIRHLLPIEKGHKSSSKGLAINNFSKAVVRSNDELQVVDIQTGHVLENLGRARGDDVRLNDNGDVLICSTSELFVRLQEEPSERFDLQQCLDKPDSIWNGLVRTSGMNNSNWVVGTAMTIYGEQHAILLRPYDTE